MNELAVLQTGHNTTFLLIEYVIDNSLRKPDVFPPVPLMMAYVTRYIFGTDKLRANSFEVRGMNGSNTGVIHVTDLAILSKWMKIISEYTNALTSQKVQHSEISSDSIPQFKLIFFCSASPSMSIFPRGTKSPT